MKGILKMAAGILLPVVMLCGCGAKDAGTTMEKIQDRLAKMESYACTATLKRISNKGENEYGTKQYYKTTGEYRLELTSPDTVAGNYTVFDGKTICQYNPKMGGKVVIDVPESQPRNELFLGQFVKNYMQSENVSIDVANMDEGKSTVLEAVIPGGNKYLATEKLWVDNETLNPVQFVIYDQDGKERYIITYQEFEYNPSLENSLFQAKQN